MKQLLTKQFNRLGISMAPKATLILECNIYRVEKCSQYIDGKKVNGYRFGDLVLKFIY